MSLSQNKKACFDYEIIEKFETGIVLNGSEIKAIRAGKANLTGTFCRIYNGEVVVLNMHIEGVEDPERSRKLLMHKNEILNLQNKLDQKGLNLIPLSLYLKRGYAKLEVGLAKSKKNYDRREELKKRDIERQKEKDIKN